MSIARVLRFALPALAIASLAATPAVAIELPFVGNLSIRILSLDPIAKTAASTAIAATDGDHIQSLALAANAFALDQVVVPVTDPGAFPIAGLQATLANGVGTFAETGGGGFGGVMPLSGVVKVCLFGTCQSAISNIDVPVSVVGSGGSVTRTGVINLTVGGAPWTTGTAAVGLTTNHGGRGGPLSLPSSTAAADGQLNLVTPVFVSTNIAASSVVPVFGFLRVGFGTLTLPQCDDDLDNDGDGFVDFPADTGCGSADDTTETNAARVCDDGLDNDGDGEVDFPADRGCLSLDDPSEGPDLACDVAMSQGTYAVGSPIVLTSLRFTNLDDAPVTTRLRLQLRLPPPFSFVVEAVDLGADGSFALAGSFDKQLGPVTMFTLNESTPIRGLFEWRCAFEDPNTGEVIVEDRATFVLQSN
jgi:hypothetical protein